MLKDEKDPKQREAIQQYIALKKETREKGPNIAQATPQQLKEMLKQEKDPVHQRAMQVCLDRRTTAEGALNQTKGKKMGTKLKKGRR